MTFIETILQALKPREYNWQSIQIAYPISEVPKGGAAYLFDNTQGAVNVYVNNGLLAAGSALSLAGDRNEADKTQYKIAYPSASGSITVWIKFYL